MTADLWNFALSLYARPGVEATCLELQAAGADVCLLLTGVWLDRHGASYSSEREQQLRQIAEPWQREQVQPLRRLQQNWRAAAQRDTALADLRERLKQLELDAEREQLRRLEALSQSWQQEPGSSQRAWLERLAPADVASASERLYLASLS